MKVLALLLVPVGAVLAAVWRGTHRDEADLWHEATEPQDPPH